jgi:hypothetical protein
MVKCEDNIQCMFEIDICSLPSYISTNQNYLTVLTISLKSNTNVFALPLRNVEHNALGNRHPVCKDESDEDPQICTKGKYRYI